MSILRSSSDDPSLMARACVRAAAGVPSQPGPVDPADGDGDGGQAGWRVGGCSHRR
jgi:hypothetical protein